MVPGLGIAISSASWLTVDVLSADVQPSQTLFADIDSMEPDAFAQHLADDVRFIVRQRRARDRARQRARRRGPGSATAIAGVQHEVIEQCEQRPATIVESTVTYTRKDDSTISFPVVTIYRGEGELIEDYRIFMDVAPLFAAP